MSDKIPSEIKRNNFTEEELNAAKEVRDFLIEENEPRLTSIYMAGEIVMWDELKKTIEGKDKELHLLKIDMLESLRVNAQQASTIEGLRAENERLKQFEPKGGFDVKEYYDDDSEEDDSWQPCDNCDLPDACADFGCAIKAGIKRDFTG